MHGHSALSPVVFSTMWLRLTATTANLMHSIIRLEGNMHTADSRHTQLATYKFPVGLYIAPFPRHDSHNQLDHTVTAGTLELMLRNVVLGFNRHSLGT